MTQKMKKLLKSAEGRLLISGLILDMLALLTLTLLFLLHAPWALKIFSMVASHVVSGRAGGISVGMEVGLPSWFIVLCATLVDSQIVLLLFPLFVFSYKNMVEIRFLKGMLDSSRKVAEKQKENISRFGVIGLMLFVWFPLHMTGPLVGAIIGHFIGLKPYHNISVVLTGTFLAVLSWVIFFRKMMVITGEYSFLIPLTIVLMAIGGFFIVRYRHKQKISKLKKAKKS